MRSGSSPRTASSSTRRIRENVRVGRLGATDREIEHAFAQLGLDDWVARLPAGLDTVVGERGDGLSVGERQLVALVRAHLAAPGLLVLDEATSAVDPETERALTTALAAGRAGRDDGEHRPPPLDRRGRRPRARLRRAAGSSSRDRTTSSSPPVASTRRSTTAGSAPRGAPPEAQRSESVATNGRWSEPIGSRSHSVHDGDRRTDEQVVEPRDERGHPAGQRRGHAPRRMQRGPEDVVRVAERGGEQRFVGRLQRARVEVAQRDRRGIGTGQQRAQRLQLPAPPSEPVPVRRRLRVDRDDPDRAVGQVDRRVHHAETALGVHLRRARTDGPRRSRPRTHRRNGSRWRRCGKRSRPPARVEGGEEVRCQLGEHEDRRLGREQLLGRRLRFGVVEVEVGESDGERRRGPRREPSPACPRTASAPRPRRRRGRPRPPRSRATTSVSPRPRPRSPPRRSPTTGGAAAARRSRGCRSDRRAR